MQLNKLILFSLLLIGILTAKQISLDYGKFQVGLSTDILVLNRPYRVTVRSDFPELSYIYVSYDSGESYFLNKNPDDSWSGDIIVPNYFKEGKKTIIINIVLNSIDPIFREKIKKYPEIQLEENSNFTVLKVKKELFVVRPETLDEGVAVSLFPLEAQPGQKVNVSLQLPRPILKASVVYGGRKYPLKQETETKWNTEIIADKNTTGKVYMVDIDNSLSERKFEVLLIPEAKPVVLSELPISQPIKKVVTTENRQEKFKIKGNKTIVFINKSKEGDVDGFLEEHRREESLNLDIAGKEGSVNVEAKIFTTTQENVDKKEDIRIKLSTDTWAAYLGDFTETVSDNELTFKNKQLSGFKFAYFPVKKYFMFISASERGTNRQEFIYGNDSQGPFYLKYVPVVIGSEQVFLDGILQFKEKDYILDYKSGKITFRNNIVQTHQIIKVSYESESTVPGSQYSAFRYRQELDWLTLGVTGINKRDINNGSNIGPLQDKKVYGLDTKFKLGYLCLDLEGARSEVIADLSETRPTQNIGSAAYGRIGYDDKRALKFDLSSKKTDADFEAVGNTDLKKELDENTGIMELNSSNNFVLRAENFRQSYKEDARYFNSNGYYKYYLKEGYYPEVRFWVKETAREIFALSATQNRILKNYYRAENMELAKMLLPNLKLGVKGTKETQEDQALISTPFKNAETYGGFIKTEGLSSIELILGSDHQESSYLDTDRKVSTRAQRNETYTRLGLYPGSKMRLGLAYRDIQDTMVGNSEIMDLDYIITPFYEFNTAGQYSITSLKETLVSQDYRVQKEKGSFSLKWTPTNYLRTNLRYNPNISVVRADHDFVNSFSALKNFNLDYSPYAYSSFKYEYLDNYAFTKDLQNASTIYLKSEDETETNIYLLRISPTDKLDLDLKYRNSLINDDDLNNTNTTNVYYTGGKGYENERGFVLYGRPNREWLCAFDYSRAFQRMDYANEPSLNIKEQRDKYGLDAKYKLDQNWTLHFFGSFLRKENQLLSVDNLIYEYAPGAGISYRLVNFKTSYDYTRTESTLGADLLNHKHDLALTYDYNAFVNLILNAEHIDSERPRYKTTSVLTKFSATF